MFDPYAVSLEWDEEANLARNCLVEVALGKLEYGEEDDADGPEDREENPVELFEKAKVGTAFDNKTTFSVSNQYCPMGPSLTYLRKSSIIALISFRCVSLAPTLVSRLVSWLVTFSDVHWVCVFGVQRQIHFSRSSLRNQFLNDQAT